MFSEFHTQRHFEKVERRLAGRKKLYLSQGGWLTLIKSTLSLGNLTTLKSPPKHHGISHQLIKPAISFFIFYFSAVFLSFLCILGSFVFRLGLWGFLWYFWGCCSRVGSLTGVLYAFLGIDTLGLGACWGFFLFFWVATLGLGACWRFLYVFLGLLL